jgi:hypothetical protein
MFGYGSGELIGKNIAIINAPINKSPEEIAGKKSIRFNAKNLKKGWDIKFSDGVKFDRVIIPQK